MTNKEAIKYLQQLYPNGGHCWLDEQRIGAIGMAIKALQGEHKPNFCHHEVDLSNCSEEYRNAYYDGWNNCNMQHSQLKSELDDVVKCLINGMKFYYEGNEEATWGTDKWSMPVKHIIEVLENLGEQNIAEWTAEDEEELKIALNTLEEAGQYSSAKWLKNVCLVPQTMQKPAWSEEDEHRLKDTICFLETAKKHYASTVELDACIDWLKSLRPQSQWKPSELQLECLDDAIKHYQSKGFRPVILMELLEELKKLKG